MPTIIHELGGQQYIWVASAYALASTALLPASGGFAQVCYSIVDHRLELEALVGKLLLECLDLALESGLVLSLKLIDRVLVRNTKLLDRCLRFGAELLEVLAVDISGLVL